MSLRDDDRHRRDDEPDDEPEDDRDDDPAYGGNDDPGSEGARDDRPRPRVDVEPAKVVVRQYLRRATSGPEPAAVDHEGMVRADLCYHRSDRPIRTFPFDPEGDLSDVVQAIVDEAVDVLVGSGAAEGSYDVRVAGQGLRSFPLQASAPAPERGGAGMARVHQAYEEDEGSAARSLLRAASEQLERERERNERLSEIALRTMGVVLDANQVTIREQGRREKEQAKRERKLHKTINKLVKQRWETHEDREELASRKHERDAEDREEARKAEREDYLLAQLMSVGPKILGHLVAAKSPALAAIASSMSAAPPPPPGTFGNGPAPSSGDTTVEPATPRDGESEEAAIMRVVHGFGSSIRPDQFSGMLGVLDEDQQKNLVRMMQMLQAHHEKHQNQG